MSTGNVKVVKGNIFTSKHQTVVNTVNCVGVMGAGIALEFRYRYPKLYEEYVKLCQSGHMRIGSLWLYKREADRKWVLNFPTKNDWKFESKPEYLEKGLQKFIETYKKKGITSIAFPLLGADRGGLDPEMSMKIMDKYLHFAEIPVEIYEYDATAKDDLIEIIYSLFTSGKNQEIAKKTGISLATVNKIRKVLEKKDIKSLSILGKEKGIGEATMEKCYQIALIHQSRPKVVEMQLFDEGGKPDSSGFKQNSLTINQKQKLTGLSLEIVLGIENNSDFVTIKDIKTYCEKLAVDPIVLTTTFFRDRFSIRY